jgi:hypothetical protein
MSCLLYFKGTTGGEKASNTSDWPSTQLIQWSNFLSGAEGAVIGTAIV